MSLIATLGALFLGTSTAQATEGLNWQMPDEGVSYHLTVRTTLPTTLTLMAEKNLEMRVIEVILDLNTTCKPTSPMGKKGWNMDCLVSAVGVQARPYAADASPNKLSILAEYEEQISNSLIQLQFTNDGRLRNLGLEKVSKRTERLAKVQESIRLILLRAYSLLDFPLPKNGTDNDKGTWTAKNLVAAQVPSSSGTMGQVLINNVIVPGEGSEIRIESRGKGTISTGETDQYGAPLNTWNARYEGFSVFDVTAHRLVEREFLLDGIPSASSGSAFGTRGVPYVQAARLEVIDPAAPPKLMGTGFISDE